METVLRSIFQGKVNKSAHDEFIKFGKGDFKNRYLVEAKRQKEMWSIKTSAEYANTLVRICLEEATKEVAVKGVIVSTMDLRKEFSIPISGLKQFMGIKQFIIDSVLKPKDILDCMDKVPKAFFALTFKTDNSELKIKPKAPKSAKPASAGDKEPKAEFCSIKTKNNKIAEEILFDLPEAKLTTIKHEIIIKDIVIPKNVSDPVQMREQSIRKGQIKRIVKIDEKEIISEADFSA
jgi:hypothetical protein